jgi:hypothetical protein
MTHARLPIRLAEGREDGRVELNARRPTGDVGSPREEAGYRSPWYTGHECLYAPEPRPYRQWREARSDWVTTQRPEDFERMLAAVTPDNPPLASDIRSRDGRAAVGQSAMADMSGVFPAAPLPPAHDHIRQAAALTAAAITALTAAVVLMLCAAFAIILAILDCGPRRGARS